MKRHIKILFVIFTILLKSLSVFANDAPLILDSGGAQVFSGSTVKMESEIVKITLRSHSYVVDATFYFVNTGETSEIDVGFPKNGQGWIDDRYSHTVDFIKFETWVNGVSVKCIEQPNMSRIEGHYTLPDLIRVIRKNHDLSKLGLKAVDNRWMIKENVLFPSNKTTITRVRYEAPYNPATACKGSFGYTYGTGEYWKGNIGKSTFIIDSNDINKEDRPNDIYISDKQDKEIAKITYPSPGIIQCVITNYKPHTSNSWIGLSIGCPQGY